MPVLMQHFSLTMRQIYIYNLFFFFYLLNRSASVASAVLYPCIFIPRYLLNILTPVHLKHCITGFVFHYCEAFAVKRVFSVKGLVTFWFFNRDPGRRYFFWGGCVLTFVSINPYPPCLKLQILHNRALTFNLYPAGQTTKHDFFMVSVIAVRTFITDTWTRSQPGAETVPSARPRSSGKHQESRFIDKSVRRRSMCAEYWETHTLSR